MQGGTVESPGRGFARRSAYRFLPTAYYAGAPAAIPTARQRKASDDGVEWDCEWECEWECAAGRSAYGLLPTASATERHEARDAGDAERA